MTANLNSIAQKYLTALRSMTLPNTPQQAGKSLVPMVAKVVELIEKAPLGPSTVPVASFQPATNKRVEADQNALLLAGSHLISHLSANPDISDTDKSVLRTAKQVSQSYVEQVQKREAALAPSFGKSLGHVVKTSLTTSLIAAGIAAVASAALYGISLGCAQTRYAHQCASMQAAAWRPLSCISTSVWQTVVSVWQALSPAPAQIGACVDVDVASWYNTSASTLNYHWTHVYSQGSDWVVRTANAWMNWTQSLKIIN